MTILAARARVLLVCLLASWVPLAAAQTVTEASVKAALLSKFANYVEWPAESFASPEAPLVIATLGADEVATELEQVNRGRAIGSRPVVIRRLKDVDGLAGSHIVFVGRREAARLATVARAARPLSILVVSDVDRGLETGSVINFVPVEDRIGFEVSTEAAERSNLRISSRMLAVARRVVTKPS